MISKADTICYLATETQNILMCKDLYMLAAKRSREGLGDGYIILLLKNLNRSSGLL